MVTSQLVLVASILQAKVKTQVYNNPSCYFSLLQPPFFLIFIFHLLGNFVLLLFPSNLGESISLMTIKYYGGIISIGCVMDDTDISFP